MSQGRITVVTPTKGDIMRPDGTVPSLGAHACDNCGLPHGLQPFVTSLFGQNGRETRRSQHICASCGRLHTVSVTD